MARHNPAIAAFESSSNMPTERQDLVEELNRQFSSRSIRRRRRARFWRTASWTIVIRTLAAFRRFCDFILAVLLIGFSSPAYAILYVLAKTRGGGIGSQLRLGRWATQFHQYRFDFSPASQLRHFAGLPALVNVLKGDISFIGPRAVSPQEIPSSERNAWKRYDIRPGIICLWWIRKRANMAYRSETDLDAEYVDTNSFWGDLGIALRALPALAYGEGVSIAPDHLTLLRIPIDNMTLSEAIERIGALAAGHKPAQLCFVNADCVNIAFRDLEYKTILQRADFVVADGIGVRLAGRILNQHIRENVNGTDLFPNLCSAMEKSGLDLYLLGGRPGVAEDVARWINKHYPNLKLSGYRHGFFLPDEERDVIAAIRESGAKVLMVAFGVPKQDKWISAHLDELGANVCIGVGGLFDFYSGRIPRAPVWMRELGMEWLYRVAQEPRRMWRRYFIGNAVFLYRVIRERWSQSDEIKTKDIATS
ncbi:MAG TPA: WecB/TagA/CpsF family glycosyltransferase [Edaphobacter sp.]|nr:WecB/TagA/CpsF family glycosyltransferase [Edaphobacter sp.]